MQGGVKPSKILILLFKLFLIFHETNVGFSPSLLPVRNKAVEFPQKQIQMVRSLRSLYNVETYG
jgi:hypothetical protein